MFHARYFQMPVVVTITSLLSGCVLPPIPIPQDRIIAPVVKGTIVDGIIVQKDIEVWVNYDGKKACDEPKFKTTTDENGQFYFEGEISSVTWIGYEPNYHDISVCVIGPDGSREKYIRTMYRPKAINLVCSISIKSGEFCSYTCEESWQNKC